MHNCLSKDLDNLIMNGFKTRQCNIRGARSINTAMQLVAVLFQIQSLQQFGGVAATHLDSTMVPFVRMSFKKHYLLEYIKQLPDFMDLDILGITHKELERWIGKRVAEYFLNNSNITDKDFVFANKTTLDPVIRQKALLNTKKETYQATEGLFHNLNSLQSRSGNQLPFSSINYGCCTELEGRMVTKAILEACIDGTGPNHTTSIFPCGIFQYKKGVNNKPGTPNYDLKKLAIYSMSKRIYPNFANCDWTNQVNWKKLDIKTRQEVIDSLTTDEHIKLLHILENDSELAYKLHLRVGNSAIIIDEEERPYELFSTMGCRTANGFDVNFKTSYERNIKSILAGNGIIDDTASGAAKDGRGNIAPATIIMPTLAMEVLVKLCKGKDMNYEEMIEWAHDNTDTVFPAFMKLLEKKIEETKDSLIERFNHIASQPVAAARFMWDNHTMHGYIEGEGPVTALRHGTLVIGQIALAETLQIIFGYNQTNPKGMEYAKQIEQLFNDKTNEFKKEYSLNFGVYYTPAENLCKTSLNNFRKKYGIIPNVSDRDYFTNSIHVPVWENVTWQEKIDIESQLTGYSNAGCITYVELPDGTVHNQDALEQVIDYAMDHDIPYMAVNIPLDTCKSCGYTGEFDACPICGSTEINRLRRITGYLSTDVSNFNYGKQMETKDRVKHTGKEIL